MRVSEVRQWVVRPVLERAKLWSPAAENLVVGTGLAESAFEWLDQRDQAGRPGPAFGPWQIEAATYWSLWDREIRPSIKLNCLMALGFDTPPPVEELHGNLFLGALVCRLKYFTVQPPLPPANDPHEMVAYWKRHYNTAGGAGVITDSIQSFIQACA